MTDESTDKPAHSVGGGLWTAKESTTSNPQTDAPEWQGRFTRAIEVSRLGQTSDVADSDDASESPEPVQPGPVEDEPAEPESQSHSQAVASDDWSLDSLNYPSVVPQQPAQPAQSDKFWDRISKPGGVVAILSVLGLIGLTGLFLADSGKRIPAKSVPLASTIDDSVAKESSDETVAKETLQPASTDSAVAPAATAVEVDSADVESDTSESALSATASDSVSDGGGVSKVSDDLLEKASLSTLARFDAAEQEYKEILAIDPKHPEALGGLAVLRERNLRRISSVINRSLLSDYRGDIDAISDSPGLAESIVKTQIDDLTAMCLSIDKQISDARQEQLPWWIALGNRRIRDGILTLPETGSALYALRRAEAIDESSPQVVSGLEELRTAIVRKSGQLLDSNETERAQIELRIAQDIRFDPSTDLLLKQLGGDKVAPSKTPESYMFDADTLMSEGKLVGDNSALALLNQALVLDPQSSDVLAKRHELAGRLVERAQRDAESKNISSALADVRIALTLEPDNSDAQALSQKLSAITDDFDENDVENQQTVDEKRSISNQLNCENDYECIGIAVDIDDREISKIASEFSSIMNGSAVGMVVKPSSGPVASTVNLLSTSNAGLSVLPSDMLHYTARSSDPVLASAARHLRYVMSLGEKTIYLIATSNITNPAELSGKRVVSGPADDNLWIVVNNLLHAYQVKPEFTYEYDTEVAIDRLISGDVDAVFLMLTDEASLSSSINQKLNEANSQRQRFHLVPLPVPAKMGEYKQESATLSGLGENIDTVSIKKVLVSYDFAQQDTDYFKMRCDELAQVGSSLIKQIDELREVGHPVWSEADWVSQCGDWRRDECFFRNMSNLAQHID